MLDLPNDVLIYIVGSWLDFRAFSNLDIAITNKTIRLGYLQLIKSSEFVYSGDILDLTARSEGIVNWFNDRRIKLGKLSADEYYCDVLKKLKLRWLNTLHWRFIIDDNDELVNVLNRCPCLTELKAHDVKSFFGCNWKFGPTLAILYLYDAVLTSDDLTAIGENCVHLRDLVLTRCNCEERTAYPLLENHFEKLQHVRFSDVGVNSIEYIIQKATNLISIVVDRDIASLLAKYCYNITTFYCSGEGSDVDDAMTKYFKQSPQLKCLEMNFSSYKVSDNCLKTLSETCTNITELDIHYKTTQLQYCELLLRGLTKLKTIYIRSEGVLDCAIQHCCPSVEIIEILTSGSQLNRIPPVFPNLRRIFVEDKCSCNDLVVNLARYCPKLESVDLFMARDVTDESAIDLVQNCPLLKYLRIWSSLHTTDKLVSTIVKYGNNLTELGLSGDKLTAAAYLALCEGCPLLKKITFDASHKLPYDVNVHEAIKKLKTVKGVEVITYFQKGDDDNNTNNTEDEDNEDYDSEGNDDNDMNEDD